MYNNFLRNKKLLSIFFPNSFSKMDFPEKCVQFLFYSFVYHWAYESIALI